MTRTKALFLWQLSKKNHPDPFSQNFVSVATDLKTCFDPRRVILGIGRSTTFRLRSFFLPTQVEAKMKKKKKNTAMTFGRLDTESI